ncbi:Ig-like domain-containing protein, partial [Pseudomonas koreensis]|uniref:Ig-like domain-containing protein n=1 Tax=Pseudomonas koreensis TaxID=198620 RepID=UPI00381664EC
MKRVTSHAIKFAVITDESQLHFTSLDSGEVFQEIVAAHTDQYVVIEPKQSLEDILVATRSGDDLLLSLKAEENVNPALKLNQFFSHDCALLMLRAEGEVVQLIEPHLDAQQGSLMFSAAPLPADYPAAAPLQVLAMATAQPLPPEEPAPQPAPPEAAQPALFAIQMAGFSNEETPQILKAIDRVGGATGDILSGGFTDDETPTLVGTGAPNSSLVLFDNGEPIDEIQVDANGQWRYELGDLTQGGHVLTVKSSASVDAPMSPGFTLVLDSAAPSEASIESIKQGTASGQLIEQGQFTNSNKPHFSGTAEAYSTVLIYNGDEQIFSVNASANGSWALSTSIFKLEDGKYEFSVAAMDAVGNIGPRSAPYKITIDTQAPLAPSIDLIEDHVGHVQGPLNPDDSTDDTMPIISGRAEPDAIVELYDNGVLWGKTQSNAKGEWIFTPSTELDHGPHTITAKVVDKAGNRSDSSGAFKLEVVGDSVAQPIIDSVIDNVGSVIGPIANGGATDDTTPTLNGTVSSGSKVFVFNGQDLLGEADITGTTWTFTLPALDYGTHTLRVVAANAAGSTSADATFTLTVQEMLKAPTITSVIDDFGSVTGQIANGGTTDDTTPTLSGTVPAGATSIEVFDGAKSLGKAVISGTTWSFTPSASLALATGTHNLRVVASDAVGSSPDATFTLTVKAALTAPTITSVIDDFGSVTGQIANGGTTDDTTPTLSGTVPLGATSIEVFDGAKSLGKAVISGTTWSFTPSASF